MILSKPKYFPNTITFRAMASLYEVWIWVSSKVIILDEIDKVMEKKKKKRRIEDFLKYFNINRLGRRGWTRELVWFL